MSVKQERIVMFADVLKDAELSSLTPPPNVHQLANEVLTAFNKNGYGSELKESGSRWWPTLHWIINHLHDIREYLRTQGYFFDYIRKNGKLIGQWKFCGKKEYRSVALFKGKCVRTLSEHYNEMLNDSKWKLDLPPVKQLPLLPDA